ncbi:amphi-Trp domain-containing protein [Pseudodesulfovibrio sp.]|nr:amphi-Trp domain-containing protein [Pseudodesulfovibrio sp.]
MGKRKIKTKETVSRQGAIDAVKDLLVGLEKGEILVGEGNDQLCFGVPDDMKLSLKGKLKGAKAKVSVSLSWKHAGGVPAEIVEGEPPAKKSKAKPPAKAAKAKAPAKKKSEKKPAKKKPAEKESK